MDLAVDVHDALEEMAVERSPALHVAIKYVFYPPRVEPFADNLLRFRPVFYRLSRPKKSHPDVNRAETRAGIPR